jgi:hypothetical protein
VTNFQNELAAPQNLPLFLPRYLQKQIDVAASIPAGHLEIIQNWQALMDDKRRKHGKGERELEADLTIDFFIKILGWHGATSKNPTLNSQYNIATENRTPDIALGHFSDATPKVIAVGEYKGAKTDLDVKQKGDGYQNRTPVEQARNYASLEPNCQFYLVTNMREWRLYAKNSSPDRYERWFLTQLHQPEHYWRFVALLSEDAILNGKTLRWLQESEQQDKEITRGLYSEYQKMRWNSIIGLAEANPEFTALEIIEPAQTLLDRILFIAFAEDNGLLAKNTFKTYTQNDAIHSSWDNLKALFQAIDKGSRDNPQTIPPYNGGLFAPNPTLENLDIPDALIQQFHGLTEYDFGTEVRVTVLGHIFEQSVAELEQLREAAEAKPKSFITDLAKRIAPAESKGRSVSGKRKQDGIVYTPDAITRFIVQQTLGRYLEAKQTEVRESYLTAQGEWRKQAAKGAATGLKIGQTENDIARGEYYYWAHWQQTLESIKVIDPSCGSGAFLVAAFDVFAPYYRELAQALRRLYPGSLEEFNGDRAILTHNLYGVDINAGAVEIAKLSLWLKTAKPGHKLDSLDGHLLCGNSLRFEPDKKSRWVSERFGWNTTFKEILVKSGFDVVLGNPPYVRMEILKPWKPFLSANFTVAAERADLYAYFYEIGLRLLKPSGCLGYISSSTFFKTAAGEPLRSYLLKHAALQTIVDFGDLQVFEGVTTYPAIVCLQKNQADADHHFHFTVINDPSQIHQLDEAFSKNSLEIPQSNLNADNWHMGDDALANLRAKLIEGHKTLKEVYGSPMYGIKTGLNEAFVIDRTIRDKLVKADPKSAELLKPFLEGKDLKKWRVEARDLWLIYIPKNRINIEDYPAIKELLMPFKEKLEKRATKQEWFELQQAQEAYAPSMEKPKICYVDISDKPNFSLDISGSYCANTAYFVPKADWFLAGLLNSKTLWLLIRSMSPFIRGGFYRMFTQYIEILPIPEASETQKQTIADLAEKCQRDAEARYKQQKNLRDTIPSLHPDKQVEKLSTALQNWWQLDFAAFQKQIKKEFKLDIPVKERMDWKELLEDGTQEIGRLTLAIVQSERELNAAIYALFGLTPEEIALIENE